MALDLMLASQATAQTFATLHNFAVIGTNSLGANTNADGAKPYAPLILSGDTLYGTAHTGGGSGYGTVFKLNTNGAGFTKLHDFASHPSDGDDPIAGLTLSGNTLYGTSAYGGASDYGTIFKVSTDGTGFTNIHSFTQGSDGANPFGGLLLSGSTLYGTSWYGGGAGAGTIFKVNNDGTGFTNLHNFAAKAGPYPYTNSDGMTPSGELILSVNTLYGTAAIGGSSGRGTLFKINTDGTGFTNLHIFTPLSSSYPYTNSDGAHPESRLVLSEDTLYGTTWQGGRFGNGTVFKVGTDGLGFTSLYSFSGGTNSDGAKPIGSLILSGNTLYGTASEGGSSGGGTVFAIKIDGTGFRNLRSFETRSVSAPYTNSTGASPYAGLILSDNTLYGTASSGGSSGAGTIFSLSLSPPPQLTIVLSGGDVVLAWPTNASGFTLQSTTNLAPPAVWTTVSPAPVIVNGQYTVTNPIAGTQQFYRLSQ